MPLQPLLDWLFLEAQAIDAGDRLFGELCVRLVEQGVPLARAVIQLDTLHPLYYGACFHWRPGGPAEIVPRSHDFARSEEFRRSPYTAARAAGGWFRQRLAAGAPTELPLLQHLADDGFTDFIGQILPSTDALPPGVTWATKRPGGFAEAEVALLRALGPYLAPCFQLRAQRRTLANVLATYLGRGPAQEVIAGRVERHDLHGLEAVLLLTDLRGFSTKAERWPEADLLLALSSYAELVVDAVHRRGGDVLKFLGDGVLAVFPISEASEVGERCRDGFAAVCQARQTLRRVNEERRNDGRDTLDFVAVLHLGRVAYGNIGARERLDFTVLGPAVNATSRIEAIAKAQGLPVAMTAAVARHLEVGVTRSVGRFALRGMGEEIELFGAG